MSIDYTKKKKQQDASYDADVNARALQMIRDNATQKRQQALQPLTQQKNDALNAYLNRGDFKYDFNADALYQHYKNQYTQQGKQAMQDTMGQAAALTGGYGSSYAQSVGQQAYNAYLQNLNDVIPELYQMAYQRYQDKGNDLLQQYSLFAGEEADAYARQYQQEQDAVSDYQWQQGFDYQKNRDAVSDAQWQQSFDYQKSQDAAAAKAESSKVTKEQAEAMALHGDYSGFAAYLNVPYEYAKTYYLANYGDPTEATALEKPIFSHVDDDGLYHYYLGGKEVKFEQGVNPLTGGANPDGVMNEDGSYNVFLDKNGNPGYQPNNIGGVKIEETGITDEINGHEQKVWRKTDDGSWWMWDDTKGVGGSYVPYKGSGSSVSYTSATSTSNYSNITSKLNTYISNGASKSEISSYLRQAKQAGVITTEEYRKLVDQYIPRGNSY